MPGPVSDSFDPEFGTGQNADDVRDAIQGIAGMFTEKLGDRRYIVDVVNGPPGELLHIKLSDRQGRIIRFALERAIETI